MSNLEDVRTKGIPIELGGKLRHFKYDLNALAALEEGYGTINDALRKLQGEIDKDENGEVIMIEEKDDDGNIIMIKDKDGKEVPKQVPQRKFSLKLLRTFVWAGLLHEDESLTERAVGAMLDMKSLGSVMPKVTEAITAAMPVLTDKEKQQAEFAARRAEAKIKENTPTGKVQVIKNVNTEER